MAHGCVLAGRIPQKIAIAQCNQQPGPAEMELVNTTYVLPAQSHIQSLTSGKLILTLALSISNTIPNKIMGIEQTCQT